MLLQGLGLGLGVERTRKKDTVTVWLLRARLLPPAKPIPLPLAVGFPCGSKAGSSHGPQANQRRGEKAG